MAEKKENEFAKTLNVSERTWFQVTKYRLAMRHKNIDETINWLIKEARSKK